MTCPECGKDDVGTSGWVCFACGKIYRTVGAYLKALAEYCEKKGLSVPGLKKAR